MAKAKTKNPEKMSNEELMAYINELSTMSARKNAIENLHQHSTVRDLHKQVETVADENTVTVQDVLIAEIKGNVDDVPGFYMEVGKMVEQWKKAHATYKNPNNPDEYWYSPDGKGNPPKWIKDAIGKKPDAKKEETAHAAWMKKLERYKISSKGNNAKKVA